MSKEKQVFKQIDPSWMDSGTNLLYFGDKHYQKQPPSSRIDDFKETEAEKVHQIRKLGKQYNIKAYLQVGDFLDKPKFDDAFLNSIMDEWGFNVMQEARELYDSGDISKEEYTERVLDYIPLIGIVGNHELYGGSLKTFNRTSLAFLNRTGFMNLVDYDHPYLIKMNNGGTVAISGAPYDIDLLTADADPKRYQPPKKYGDVDIFMVHEALYDTQFKPEMNWMPLDRITKTTKADLTIAGHIHSGFGWRFENGKLFGNPGALAQQSVDQNELDRTVCVTLIHIDDDNNVFVRDIPLDLQDPKDIFDLSYKEDKIEVAQQLESVKKIIDSVKKVKDTNAANIIEQVAKTEEVDKESKELAISKTEEAMSVMGANTPLDRDVDYSISKIILKNFESHSYSEIELNDQLSPTLLIGESSQGKSSVLRAIYWVLENEGDGKSFLRRYKGINEVSVELIRADGTSVKRIMEFGKTKSGTQKVIKNGWIIKYNDGETTETNTEGLGEVQSLFGMNYLKLDTKETLPINFMKQEDGWYFIGLKPPQRAKVIGALYGTQYILSAIKSLESQRRSLESDRKSHKSDIESIKDSLKPLETIDDDIKLVEEASEFFKELEVKNKKLEDIIDINNQYSKINSEKIIMDQFINNNDGDLIESKTLMNDLISKQELIDKVSESNDAFKNHKLEIKKLSSIKDEEEELINAKELIKKLETKELSLVEIKDSFKVYDLGNKFIKLFDAFIKKERTLKTIDKLMIEIDSVNVKLDAIIDPLEVYNKNSKVVKELDLLLNDQKKELKEINSKLEISSGNGNIGIGSIKIYNIKLGDTIIMDDKIKELKERHVELTDNINSVKTRREVALSKMEDAENKLKSYDVKPEDGDKVIKELTKEVQDLYETIDSKLNKVSEEYEKIEK